MITVLHSTTNSMSMFSQYLTNQAKQLQNLMDTPTTKFSRVLRPKVVRDVADLTIACEVCDQLTASVDCHEVELVTGFDIVDVVPVCPSCYKGKYADCCLERNEKHAEKFHANGEALIICDCDDDGCDKKGTAGCEIEDHIDGCSCADCNNALAKL